MLSIYLILGTVADNAFILNDSLKQAKFELANRQSFARAYRLAISDMMTSSSTSPWPSFSRC